MILIICWGPGARRYAHRLR